MPSLKLSNPFRRGADRPSLRDRAASLKATAGRVMKRPKALPEAQSPAASTAVTVPTQVPADRPAPADVLTAVPLDSLFALADLYWNASRQFHVAAFWPKIQAGAERPGQDIAIHEGDRLSDLFAAVVAEMARREPRNDIEADQRREWQVRRALECGDERGALLFLMGSPVLGGPEKVEA